MMRHEPGLREDAKNLSIVAGSAMLAALLTAGLVSARLGSAKEHPVPADVDPPAVEAQQADARFILIGHGSHDSQDLHVVVVRTGDGKRVVTVHSGGGVSGADGKDASESSPTH